MVEMLIAHDGPSPININDEGGSGSTALSAAVSCFLTNPRGPLTKTDRRLGKVPARFRFPEACFSKTKAWARENQPEMLLDWENDTGFKDDDDAGVGALSLVQTLLGSPTCKVNPPPDSLAPQPVL